MQVVIWTTLVLGGWLVISPFTIPYTSRVASAEDLVVGMLIVLFSLFSIVLGSRRTAPVWVLIAFGIWVPIAPFVLGYYPNITTSNPIANDIVVGSLVILLGAIRLVAMRRPQVTEL